MITVFVWLCERVIELWNACRNQFGYFGSFIIGTTVLSIVLRTFNSLTNKQKGIK